MSIKCGSLSLNIELTGLKFHAHHGVFAQERTVGNDFIVDFAGTYPPADNEHSDNLSYTVSYADIFEVIEQEMLQPSDLIEDVARRIIESVLSKWPQFSALSVSVTKVRPPVRRMDGSARVTMSWSATN